MAVARRLCSLLVALGLALGTLASAAHAGGMAEMDMAAMASSEDVSSSMPEGCPDCAAAAKMAICAQTVCGIFVAILPRADLPAAGIAASFTVSPHETGTGLARFPDTPPPRRSFMG